MSDEKKMIPSDEQGLVDGQLALADPHGLLDSGERLCTIAELAAEHQLSRKLVRHILQGPEYVHIRFVSARRLRRYSAYDFAAVVLRLRPQIEERAKRIAETVAAEAERGRARRVAETKAATKPKAAPSPPPLPPKPARGTLRRGPSVPEVIVIGRSRGQ
jgi:hypothetical protein